MNASDYLENWLKNQGFRSHRDDDGDLIFKYEGLTMYSNKDENDKSFLRIVLPQIYKVDGNRTKVLEAINTISRDIKAVKAFLVDDSLFLSIEMFIDSTPDIDDFVERCLDILVKSYRRIGSEILD